MSNPRKLRVDVGTLRSVLRECAVENVSAYLDRETGEILLAPDMLPEELQDRRRFLKTPSEKIYSVNREQAENWLKNTLQAFAQIYDEVFLHKAKFQLEQTFKNDDFSEKVHETINELEREALDDNFFESWLEFVDKQEKVTLRSG